MTHDELLAEIDRVEIAWQIDGMNALRAVVELHKPEYVEVINDFGCMSCRHGAPCPTIQAIEKELG